MRSDTRDIGRLGEEAAAELLRGEGYQILHRNWRAGRYELDIVATKGEHICFVEVKTRRARGLTAPEDAFTPHKLKALARAADAYLHLYAAEHLEPRFDLVAVECEGGRVVAIRHIPDAGTLSWH